ncbi:FkbM family methyltransferase [Kibdelosporangium banguiense]|uniref:FkbM family methyltransferase n=1 Tax=Kibdelosporangium banguiense TaxID=1365924 RepID=A0ABS4T848_9PSEU|nr:FkbM family methyltransferase [Kibdelosporangium banguiense]MBP2320587.1 FkbM family methyltransferase [Kibdelosporangium banguiense]
MTEVSACTVATSAQLPAARVTAESFRAAHPGARFDILLVDGEPGGDVLTPSDIGISDDELAMLSTAYTAAQVRAVLRPQLLKALLGNGPVVYLDPWVLVLASFDGIVQDALKTGDFALVPRVLQPLPHDGLAPTPEDLIEAGVYEPGFLAVGPGAGEVLNSWSRHARRTPEAADGFLDGLPALAKHHVIRDVGVGLSVWNAGQRDPELLSSGYIVQAVPIGEPLILRTVHFHGFDPKKPWLFSADITDRPRVLLSERPGLENLCEDYRAKLVDAGMSGKGKPFARLSDGTTLPEGLRAEFRKAWQDADVTGTQPPPAATDEKAFLRWACASVDGLPGSTRWAHALWLDDKWLRERYPDPFGANGDEFRRWCEGEGVLQGRLHPVAVPAPPPVKVELVDQLGVSVLGVGPLAESVRLSAGASGLPVSADARYPVVLCCGDVTDVPLNRHVVQVTDEPIVPSAGVDEVWVPWPAPPGTQAVVLPVPDQGEREEDERDEALANLGVPSGAVFTSFVDHDEGCCPNESDVVAAFRAAFPDRSDVTLLLAVRGAADQRAAAERLRLATAHDRRIRLVEAESAHRLAVDAADWVVLLHAKECATATELSAIAARGVPLITTNIGVAAELFDSDSVMFVSRVDRQDEHIQHAARLMRELAPDTARADKVGAAGRTRVLERRSIGISSEQLRERVEHAYRSWRVEHGRRVAGEPDPFAPLQAARHALLRQPDVEMGHRIPMAPALRKAVLRVLNHYDHHVRAMMGSIVDSVDRSTREVIRRQEELAAAPQAEAPAGPDPRVDRLTTALDTAMRRIENLEDRLIAQTRDRDESHRAATAATRTADALRRVMVREHERVHGGVEGSSLVLTDAGLLRLPSDDIAMLPLLSSNGVWEQPVADLIDSLIEPDGVFLDIGAYVGYHTLRMLTRMGNSGAVIAVEPDPKAVQLLRRNIAANLPEHLADRLFVVEAAAWDTEGTLVTDPALGGGVSVWPGAGEPERTVPSVRLDKALEALKGLGKLRLSVIKADVPGRSHRALAGLVRLLRRDRPHVICSFSSTGMKELGDDPLTVLREFRTWGYEAAFVGDQQTTPLPEMAQALASSGERNLWLRPLTSRFDFAPRD